MRSLRHSLICVAAVLFANVLRAEAEDAQWFSDYPAAVAKAKAEHRNIFMDFEGSDWCPPCIQMEKEVFSTSEFKAYAAKNLVLMRVDFPQRKPLPQKVQDQNVSLQDKYAAENLPSFVLTDATGKVLWKYAGYLEGGPRAFIAELSKKK